MALRSDSELVLAAVQQDGNALQWASSELKQAPDALSTSQRAELHRRIHEWAGLSPRLRRWRKLRDSFTVVRIALYWQKHVAKAVFAPGQKRVLDAYERDFGPSFWLAAADKRRRVCL